MKKQVKRYASVLTALAMLFGVCTAAVPASAATINIEDEAVAATISTYTIPGATLGYQSTTSGTAKIIGQFTEVYSANLVIPEMIYNYKVTKIASNAFNGKKDYLSSVFIPETVTVIGDSAFFSCSSLKSVMMENSNDGAEITLESGIFAHCKSLTDVTLSNCVKEFPYTMFQGCKNLKTLTMHGNIKSSTENTFTECDALTTLIFERGVTRIKNVFGQLKSHLTKIVIVNKGVTIDDNAFPHGSDGTVICGYKGSAAEQFAKKHGNPFCELSTKAKVQLHNGKSYFIGDITTNNVIEDDDHRYLQGKLAQLVSFPKDKWHEVLADVNKDGSVDIRDVTSLQRYLAQK